MEEIQVVKAQLADAQWRQATRLQRHIHAPTPQQQRLWLGLLGWFFFFLVLVLKKSHSSLFTFGFPGSDKMLTENIHGLVKVTSI